MFMRYTILKLKIFIRTLFDELSLMGIVLLFLIVLIISAYGISVIKEHKYCRHICVSLFLLVAFVNSLNKKDYFFLRSQGINALNLKILHNIGISAIFWFFDYKLIPLYLIISLSLPLLINKFHIKVNSRVIYSPFLKGSFEWISGFRSYVLTILFFEIILMCFGVVYNNQNFVQVLFISFSIALSFLFINTEPYFYIRQYRTVNSLLKAKIRHIILNYVIVCSPLILLQSIFFFEKTAIFLVYSAFALLMIMGNLFIKYIYYINEYLRQLLQVGMLALYIISCVYPPFVVFLLLFVIISWANSVKRLKELYYDESK